MPAWQGKWKGGRYYTDELGRPVYFIERKGRSLRLKTHDEQTAISELGRYLDDPEAYVRKPPPEASTEPVHITKERVQLYLDHISGGVKDHRDAKKKQIHEWADLKLDLRSVDRNALRLALASFKGGHRGRTETLNAFCRFLVREGDLPSWNPLVNTKKPKASRAERVAYSIEQLKEAFANLTVREQRDAFRLRVSTGMHHTEIQQLEGARLCTGPLPDKGAWIRTLPEGHEIAGVLQVLHKKKDKKERRHRVSLTADCLAAALRLQARGVPTRSAMWKNLEPHVVPSNLRHSYVTLSEDCGRLVEYAEGGGVERSRIAQIVGHRAGSTMTADRYDKQQVPPMIVLPLGI
jgi:integrase